jgi:septum formation protein
MALWRAADPLVLASRSEVRKNLLVAAGIAVEVCPADLDERKVEAGAPAADAAAAATLLARAKARAVAQARPGRFVLGADQTLALGGERFSKPPDAAAARAQLRALAGKTHELHSAVAIVRDGEMPFAHVGVARLSMRPLSSEFIDRYVAAAGSAATASVGGYQLEGLGIHLFDRIEGDYFTVLGLPLLPVLDFLRRQGLLAQ